MSPIAGPLLAGLLVMREWHVSRLMTDATRTHVALLCCRVEFLLFI